MILNDVALLKWAADNGVIPFNKEHVNPASIDLTFGADYIDTVADAECHLRDYQSLWIYPGDFILGTTVEFISIPEDCLGVLYLKSSLARKGLNNLLAGLIDPGFCGQITLELHSLIPVNLRAGQRICQLVLQRMEEPPTRSYKLTGHYNGQTGPTKARY